MRTNKKEERIRAIFRLLQQNGGMTIASLSEALNVSSMTVRRDIEPLIDKGLINNVSGAIIFNGKDPNGNAIGAVEYSLLKATTSNIKEKHRIGQYAAMLIEENDCIIIDNGSTTEFVAEHIDSNVSATIATCNLNIANKLSLRPNINIILAGGYYHPDTSMFESTEGLDLIRRVRANKVFVSAAGVHLGLGVTCVNSYEVDAKKAIMDSGAEKILVFDSSKFSKVSPCFFATIDQFDQIITDENIPDVWVKALEEAKIKLVVV